jgi:hypothetical protein
LASKSRLEAIVDDLKAHGAAEVMEVERMRRQLQDQTDTIESLRQRSIDIDKIREQNFNLASSLQQLESNNLNLHNLSHIKSGKESFSTTPIKKQMPFFANQTLFS